MMARQLPVDFLYHTARNSHVCHQPKDFRARFAGHGGRCDKRCPCDVTVAALKNRSQQLALLVRAVADPA